MGTKEFFMYESKDIKAQYTDWVYPTPIFNIEEALKQMSYSGDPRHYGGIYFPLYRKKNLNIYVSGCGVHQASIIAYNNPQHSVFAVDVSQSSIDHNHFLKNKYNLSNLTLKCSSLFDLPDDPKYDLIVSTGVIHHLKSPVEGLRKLKNCLKDDGVISLMVYGYNGRSGVYMAQRALKRLIKGKSLEDVKKAREIIEIMPKDHPCWEIINSTQDISYDSGFVDLFLNSQDVAYTVLELSDLVTRADLCIHSWMDRGVYNINNYSKIDKTIQDEILNLSEIERFDFCDNIASRNIKHHVNLSKKSNQNIIKDISKEIDEMVIARPFGTRLAKESGGVNNNGVTIVSRSFQFKLDRCAYLIYSEIGNDRTMLDIVNIVHDRPDVSILKKDIYKYTKELFLELYERGHIEAFKRN